ncbi:phage portal protein [Lysinibacillus sphaericus]|uniref:Uncharacterized protein n=1 Tax=Lysinibacillus sphaericus CBAM5 TaxID=1400869 RepID=W7SAG2_LYSSH|nr:phage portal protein [Lysinibacillus sphaericus]EWH33438.1 hypothetical protein P799_10885 [Lysinibacillus sphaericus CBAM5]MBG9727598.1 hypothetical protein [Lysinibacillus fusiformis]AMO33386.1 hypothetical protein AR327_13520 [Lysinibacillus sphaericus]AMR91511.1 hypothetical protein A1T07_15700 [Lysinibacillus sphaericus]ANA45558.1 hypothetical protein A2J09_08360 [Lysinibacillus sphaericus]
MIIQHDSFTLIRMVMKGQPLSTHGKLLKCYVVHGQKKGICSKDDYLKVWYEYKCNIPIDLLSEAQASQALKGLVSERTRLSKLSIVDDVDYELEEIQKDAQLYGNELESLNEDNDDPKEVDET